MSKILSESERMELVMGLRQAATTVYQLPEDYSLDERGLSEDGHLLFEALHVLADGLPERLFAMLHKDSCKSHPEANPGKTYLHLLKIAENGAQVM